MITKFKKIVDTKHAATIQGRLVTVEEAKCVCESFNNLTEPFNKTFIKMPIDKIIDFSSKGLSKKRFNINEYIDKIQLEKLYPTIQKEIRESEIIYDNTPIEIESEILENFTKIPTIKDEFYRNITEQLDTLKSNSSSIDISVNSVDVKLEKLTESSLSMITTFEKLTEYLEKNNSTSIIKELHENMIVNQKFVLHHHKILFENQTALMNAQTSLIETQKLITDAITSLGEKISLILSQPQSLSPIINVNDPVRNTIKVVERNEAGLITKIIESSIGNDIDDK